MSGRVGGGIGMAVCAKQQMLVGKPGGKSRHEQTYRKDDELLMI